MMDEETPAEKLIRLSEDLKRLSLELSVTARIYREREEQEDEREGRREEG